MEGLWLPEEIKKKINGMAVRSHTIGMSGAGVYSFSGEEKEYVLKVEKEGREPATERQMLSWLRNKLPVPEIVYADTVKGNSYILMTALSGEMACSDAWLAKEDEMIAHLAEGLKLFWEIDPADCPVDNTLEEKLWIAADRVKEGKIDLDDWEENNPFETPYILMQYLFDTRPKEDIVVTHGDYCLPNIFLDKNGITGFIDLGRGGLADRYQDIALCVRTLGYNLGHHGGVDKLFAALDIAPDYKKIDYYILLDEVF